MAASKAAVIGIDLGSSASFVGYVGKGIVDLVQNEVSNRATSSIVGFTDRGRLLGDAALAQIRSNAKNSCRNFKHLLGRDVDAPDLVTEHFWSTCKLGKADDGFAGYDVCIAGDDRVFSASQVTAMFLTKLRDITERWCQAKVADAVISVPASFTDVQRQAVLDAARIAGLPVLKLLNEHTATALAYGIYRSNDFDAEKPLTVVFCSMGHSIFSVSIVQFIKGKLSVLCEKSDKVGGRDMDECLMREFASQFKKKFGCDPLSNKKAAFKLEDAVTKTKKVLSANSEAPVTVECLMEDEDFASNINRQIFEDMCQPMMARVNAVLEGAKAASGLTDAQIDIVEVVGGASRVPWVKKMCSDVFGGKEISTTMNADESVARGCALQAAILSPLYKVRDFTVEESSQAPINLCWNGGPVVSDGDGDARMDGEFRMAPVFPAGSVMNILKMLTFYRQGPFDIKAEFAGDSFLPPLTPKQLGTYHIDVPVSASAQKVKVKARLSLNGIFMIEDAQMVVEESYEETVREKRKIVEEDVTSGGANGEKAEETAANQEGQEKKEEKKEGQEKKEEKRDKYEWVDAVKVKTRVKRTNLRVTAQDRPGLSQELLQQWIDGEITLQAQTRDLLETDEKRNDLESYIFTLRDKTAEGGEYGQFISAAEREQFRVELGQSEDWLYDAENPTKAQYVEQLDKLNNTGSSVVWRFKEDQVRADWVAAIGGTVKNYKDAAQNPGDKYGHISKDKLSKVVSSCNSLEKWLSDLLAKQQELPKHEKPVLLCADMESKNQQLANLADDIFKEPKPAPKKEDKKAETKKEDKKNDEKKEAPPEAKQPSEKKEEGVTGAPDDMDVD